MTQRATHIIDGLDRGGKPHKNEALVTAAIAEFLGEILPEVDGHQITPLEWAAYQASCELVEVERNGIARVRSRASVEVCAKVGIAQRTLTSMKATGWWKEMDRIFVEERQKDFHRELSANQGVILEGGLAVSRGDDPGDKTANAKVQMVKAFMESGADPIINRRPNVNITHNTQHNILNIDPGKFRDMSKAELFEFARTGKRPMVTE